MGMENLYHEKLMQRYKQPHHKGELVGQCVFTSERINPACGDQVTVFIQVDNGTITQARFIGTGCVLSLATADLLMEHVTGLSLPQAATVTAQTVQELTGVHVSATRQQCITLPLQALKQALTHARPS